MGLDWDPSMDEGLDHDYDDEEGGEPCRCTCRTDVDPRADLCDHCAGECSCTDEEREEEEDSQ